MKILLTGSSGFIGSNFMHGYKSTHNIVEFSLLKSKAEDAELKDIETVVHLGALVHNMSYLPFSEYEYHNVKQTLDLAKHAKEAGVKHFVFMSTIKVYGDMKDGTCFDESSSCHPSDMYGKSKLLAEEALLELSDATFIVSIIRTPVVYGPGVKANILSLIKLIDKSPILPFANIDNKRNFIYVENLCALIDAVIKDCKRKIYLASDGKAISTTELTYMIKDSLKKKSLMLSLSILTFFIKTFLPGMYERLYGSLCINASKTYADLNFSPPFSAKEGINKTVKWYLNDN